MGYYRELLKKNTNGSSGSGNTGSYGRIADYQRSDEDEREQSVGRYRKALRDDTSRRISSNSGSGTASTATNTVTNTGTVSKSGTGTVPKANFRNTPSYYAHTPEGLYNVAVQMPAEIAAARKEQYLTGDREKAKKDNIQAIKDAEDALSAFDKAHLYALDSYSLGEEGVKERDRLVKSVEDAKAASKEMYAWDEEERQAQDRASRADWTVEEYQSYLDRAQAATENLQAAEDALTEYNAEVVSAEGGYGFRDAGEKKRLTEAVKEARAEYEKYNNNIRDEAYFYINEDKYKNLPYESDWKEKSAYDPSVTDTAYRAVNIGSLTDDESGTAPTVREAFKKAFDFDSAKVHTEVNKKGYDYLEPQEIQTYNYLYKTDPAQAQEYLNYLKYSLNERKMEQYRENMVRYAKELPVTASLHSVPENLISGIGYIDAKLQYSKNRYGDSFKPVDYNTKYQKPYVMQSTVRGTISEDLGGGFGKAYQIGMSMADSLAVGLLSAAGLPYATSLLGGSAATSTMHEAKQRGATDDQAIQLGYIAGWAEAFFEKVSIDKFTNTLLSGNVTGVADILKNAFWQAVPEATEEGATTIANTIADAFIMGDKSELAQKKQMYISMGYSEDEAARMAGTEWAQGLFEDMAGGFISGGIMGGIASVGNYAMNEAAAAQDAKNQRNFDAMWKAAHAYTEEAQDNGGFAPLLNGTVDETGAWEAAVNDYVNQNTDTAQPEAVQQTEVQNKPESTEGGTKRGNLRDLYKKGKDIASNEKQDTETVGDFTETSAVENTSDMPDDTAQYDMPETDNASVVSPASESLEETSKEYGKQAGAFAATYEQGQDVAQYNAAYRTAFEMGKAYGSDRGNGSLSLERLKDNEDVSYLTDTQKELAYRAGMDASASETASLDAQINSGANGKTGWRRGVVIGENGITGRELQHTYNFNSQQVRAYDIFSSAAEVTGIDIVLYRSETDANGDFIGASARYNGKKEPGRVYIDINAGLDNIKSAGDLYMYAMGRALGHEFTHVLERWNPMGYNEFRRFVLDTIDRNAQSTGESTSDELIQIEMDASPGMSYEKASREVVAEAMTDIFSQANFVQELADKHRNIFEKLLEKLKEFAARIREYWKSLGENTSRAARGVKEAVGETLRYTDELVKMYDSVAVKAVENYQSNYAVDEVSTKNTAPVENAVQAAESTPTVETPTASTEIQQPKVTESEYGYTITDNPEYGSIEVKFKEKPSEAVRDVLKGNKFRWNGKRKLWYGKAEHETIQQKLDSVYAEERTAEAKPIEEPDFTTIFNNAAQEERDEVVDAINENTKISHIAPTEIRENIPAQAEEIKEEKTDGENETYEGTVHQSESDGDGAPQLLEGLQAEDVQGAGGQREALAADKVGGRQAERDGDRADAADRTGGREGNGESGNLRRDDGLKEQKESLKETVTRQVEQQSTVLPKGSNFVIGDSLNLPTGEKARFGANIDAIRLIKQLEAEGRFATPAEQEILSKYVGWGGLSNAFGELKYNSETHRSEMTAKRGWEKEFDQLKQLVSDGIITENEYENMSASTKNAHYTSVEVIKAMYDGLKQLGFNGGRMLEPSSGVGNFVGAMPTDMSAGVKSWTMVELDRITGQIAKYLYPNADVRIQGFEEANIPDGYMDVAIGNVPFGNYGVVDRNYPKRITKAIHNYFFGKTLDKVRPGGVVMFITSRYTMDSENNAVREYISKRADLLGAIRLPNTAFSGNAGTQVVTDILVLKKRPVGTEYGGEIFLDRRNGVIPGTWEGINEYFVEHPEMALGTAKTTRGMYAADSLTYEPIEDGRTLREQITDAFKNISGKMDYKIQTSSEKANFAAERANRKTKDGGLEVKDGKVYRNVDGNLEEVDRDAEHVSGLLAIRDAYRTLINDLQQDVIKAEKTKARNALNKAYDDFVKKYGPINAPKNKSAIADDPDQYSLLSLENYNAKKKTATKADIFTKDTITPIRTVTHVDDMASGVIVSVNRTGGIDTSLIAQITGKTEESVTRELIDSRMAFKTKDGSLETPETYLSGNVRAKLREAEALAPFDKDFQNNVDELKKVVPKDIPFNDIYAAVGAPWIPNRVYADFIAEMLGGRNIENSYSGPDVTVGRTSGGDFKIVINNNRLKTRYQNTQQWGTSRRSFLDIMSALMAGRGIRVNDYIKDDSGKKKAVLNKVETAAANEKAEEITKKFQEWLWQDENRKKELSYLYNETFNALVTPKYNGKNLTVNGINAEYQLRAHQADAVQRIISSGGNTLLAHRVGAGKTLEMAAAAMKLRELGIVKKPMFVVPKSLVAQWGTEFKNYFPAARLLVAGEDDFSPDNRKTYVNRIANGEYDAVVVSYQQFEKIPLSAEYQAEFYRQQIREIIDAIAEEKAESKNGRGITVKEMEKKKAQYTKKIAELTSKPKDEDNINFEELGVDSLFVDEAHNFKNLFYTTRMTNVSGLGTSDGVGKTFDMFTKIRYLQGLNGGRGIVFATATPVMNSMAEMYIMQKYLQNDVLNNLGLKSFDAWAKQFGEVVNAVEIKPSGQGFRVKQTFSNFRNLNELQLLFRGFADVLTEVPGLKIPKMKGGKVKIVECEMGQFQKDYMAQLEERADNIQNVDQNVDNMLKITGDGRKAAYTQRMIDPSLPYEPGCKIFRCCDNVITEYNESSDIRGTQLIFCDMSTPKGKSSNKKNNSEETDDSVLDESETRLYDDMRAYLVERGIPAKEIAFIHEAKTDAKKKQLFADMNDGKVRVLIGSTGKMGVGMNAQERIVAIHHLDAPWRPGDVEQRDGRAFRQKNMNAEVSKYVYVTTGSFDARMWDILDRKQHFINQIMNGEDIGRSAEDTGNVTLSAAEVKAIASGNPLIAEQVTLTNDLAKLHDLKRAHTSSVFAAKEKLLADEQQIGMLEKSIENCKADIKARVDTYSEGKFSMTVGKSTFTEKKDAGAALAAAIISKAKPEVFTSVGRFAGFELRVMKKGPEYIGHLTGHQAYRFNVYTESTTRMVSHIAGVAEGLETRLKAWESALAETKADLEAQNKLIAQPFAKQEELNQKTSRYNEVMAILNPKEEQAIVDDEDEDDGTQYQRRKSYWRPNLSKAEWNLLNNKTEVEIASNDQFLDAATKWLYSKEKGVEVFAIYGIGDGTVPTVLYASGGKQASSDNAQLTSFLMEYNNGTIAYAKTIVGWSEIISSVKGKLYGDYDAHGHRRKALELNGILAEASERIRNSNSEYGISDSRELNDTQHQRRVATLSDREVLSRVAHGLNVAGMTEAQKGAFDVFRRRIDRLGELELKRMEQGKLYREQQFGENVDREEAKKTLNRMHILDDQIQRANEQVLEVEEKDVLRQILKKARQVIEQEQLKKDREMLRRYNDRRRNSAAIKKYRERIRKDVDDLTGWILSPDNKSVMKHVPEALKSSTIQFLLGIDFTSKRQLNGGVATKADMAFAQRLSKLEKAMRGAVGFDMNEAYAGYTDLAPDFMETLAGLRESAQTFAENNGGEFVINQMTSDELQSLSKVVRELKAFIKTANTFHRNAMFRHVDEAGDNTIEYMSDMAPAESVNKYADSISHHVFWQQMRPAYIFERFGEGGIAILNELQQGQGQLAFNAREILDFAKKAYTPKEVSDWENEIKTIELGENKKIRMSVSHIMSLYELGKREQALGHILGEGIRVATFTRGSKKYSDNGHVLEQSELETIINELTPRQKEVADSLQRFMQEKGGAWGNHVSLARFGEEQFGEEHYFPINSDGRHLSANIDEQPGAASLYALLNMGFTKQTQEKAANRIVIYSIFDVFANHMASMAQYNALALPVVDALKWFNYQQIETDEKGNKIRVIDSVRDQMDRVYGVPEESKPGSGKRGYAQSFVINILKAYNGTEAQGTPMDTLGLKMLHRYAQASVAFNLRVVIQQPTSIVRAAYILPMDSLLSGMAMSPAEIKRNIAEMQQYNGIAAWKGLGFFDVNISRGLTHMIKQDAGFVDKTMELGMKGAEFADTITWAAMWNACKVEVQRKQELSETDGGFWYAVTKLFDEVIYKTQVVDSVLTKNEFMRDKGFFAKTTGLFMGENTANASLLLDQIDQMNREKAKGASTRDVWKKHGKKFAATLFILALSGALAAAAASLPDASRDDDDYATFYEKWWAAFKGNVIDELVPLGKIPLLSEVYELMKTLLNAFGVDTYGFKPTTVVIQWWDSLVNGTKVIADKVNGKDTNYTWYAVVYKYAQAVSGATGIPLSNIIREGITTWNNFAGAVNPEWKVKTYDPGEKNSIKYAFKDKYLTEDEAIQELLTHGIVENYNEAYWLIREWKSADDSFSKYGDVYKAMLAGGDITEAAQELTEHGADDKDVTGAIKSQTGKWYRDGNITRQQAFDMMVQYGGLSEEEAEQRLKAYDWKAANPEHEDITASAVSNYEEYAEPAGISEDEYYSAWKAYNAIEADYDSDGKAIPYSKTEKVMEMIDSLDLTAAQKTALARCWYSNKTIAEYRRW